MGRRLPQTFIQRRQTNGQPVREKKLNIPTHEGNADQNHKEVSPHTFPAAYPPTELRISLEETHGRVLPPSGHWRPGLSSWLLDLKGANWPLYLL